MGEPTVAPSTEPSPVPTEAPSMQPSLQPTGSPSFVPSSLPTDAPTLLPTTELTTAPITANAEPTTVTKQPTIPKTELKEATPTAIPSAATSVQVVSALPLGALLAVVVGIAL